MHAVRQTPLLALALIAAPTLSASELEEVTSAESSWPQWRGPTRDGRAPGKAWGPSLGSEFLSVDWRVESLGPSYSGPVADERRVYTTESVDETHEVVRAFDRASGEELWRTSWEGAMQVPFFAARNGSWIRSTPAIDGDSLYVAGMRDVLSCLDSASGEVRWSVDFKERFESDVPPFGCVSSPLVSGPFVYIQAGASLVKLDRATGQTIWRSMIESGDPMHAGAFSSPVLAELGGTMQLIVQSRAELSGIELEDGRSLWTTPVKAFRGMNILTPTVIGDGVFTSSYGGRSNLFVLEEGPQGIAVERLWESGLQGYMTSPVVVDGSAYLFLKNNRFGCLDVETGEERWISPPTGDGYWSIAVQGDRILALSDTGMLRLLQADPEKYHVLSEREVSEEETWAHLAPAGGQLFVRAQNSLVALGWN